MPITGMKAKGSATNLETERKTMDDLKEILKESFARKGDSRSNQSWRQSTPGIWQRCLYF